VSDLFVPGTSPAAWRRARQLVKSGWECGDELAVTIRVGVGVHPYWSHELDYAQDSVRRRIVEELGDCASALGACAIGEIGLDKRRGAPPGVQVLLFEAQLDLAKQLNLPVVMHQVGLQRQFLETLKRVGLPARGGVVHGFSGEATWATTLLRRGLFLGVGAGIVHPARARLRAALGQLSLHQLLLETNAPDGRLRPAVEGIHSEPSDVTLVARQLAQLLSRPQAEVARVTFDNAKSLFD
jgi:TatD DNase family protein